MVLVTLAVLAVIALPVLAGNRSRSEQVSCLNNLRQIGRAYHFWANDHEDKLPCWASIKEGGMFIAPGETAPPTWPGGANIRNNAYFHFAFISNELKTPKILVCPSDQGVGAPRKIASDFSTSPNGGLLYVTFKNNALSYLVGLHAAFIAPRSIMSADRNIRYDASNGGCSSQITVVQTLNPAPYGVGAWTNAIHGLAGNLLFTDGSAEQTSILGLREALSLPAQRDNGSLHIISPP